MGAMLGTAYGAAVHHLAARHPTAPAGAYGLVGMGAVFAAAARAPITAVIIIFELTGDYRIILPLMFAIALATGVSQPAQPRHDLHAQAAPARHRHHRGRGANLMSCSASRTRCNPCRSPSRQTLATRPSAARRRRRRAGRRRGRRLPRHDHRERVEEAIRENALDATLERSLRTHPSGHANVEEALTALLRRSMDSPSSTRHDALVGWLTHVDVLRAYNARDSRGLRGGVVARSRRRRTHVRLRPPAAAGVSLVARKRTSTSSNAAASAPDRRAALRTPPSVGAPLPASGVAARRGHPRRPASRSISPASSVLRTSSGTAVWRICRSSHSSVIRVPDGTDDRIISNRS